VFLYGFYTKVHVMHGPTFIKSNPAKSRKKEYRALKPIFMLNFGCRI
jgi:hypothetical protein